MTVDPNIQQKADDIREKVYGNQVRESLASGLEAMSSDVVENKNRQNEVETQFQQVIEETTGKDVISAPEIIAARNNETNLKARLDKEHQEVTAQLAQNETHILETKESLKTKMEIEYKKPFDFSRIPINANGEYNYNNSPYVQDNLTTYNGHQYAVYVGVDKKPIVAKRKLPDGKWSTRDLSTLSGNPLASPVQNNLHNTLVIAVDSQGFIHIVGNMHNSNLKYIVSQTPENINNWQTRSMTGTNENAVTYPQFVKNRVTDELLFFYRNGGSGDGKTYINRYNVSDKKWSKVNATFISPSGANAYLNHIAVDESGTIHIMYCFRTTTSANTNNNICYAKSENSGTTWKRSDGSVLSLPLTESNSEIVINTAPTGSGLVNQSGLEVDSEGNPHAAFLYYDSSNNTQIFHIWHDGETWNEEAVTDFNFQYSTDLNILTYEIGRPSVATGKDGGVYIIYRVNKDGKRGALRIIDVTPGRHRRDTELIKIDFHDAEPIFDTVALYERNELSMLLIPGRANGVQSVNYEGDRNWGSQVAGVYTFDLSQADLILRQLYKVPEIRELSTFVGIPSGNVEWSSSTEGDLPIGGALLDKRYKERGEILFAKLLMRAVINGSTDGEVNFSLHEQGAAAYDKERYGILSVKLSIGARFFETPWLVTRTSTPVEGVNAGGFVNVSARSVNGTARVTLLEVRIGVLDY